jgi:hypothetical protein
VQSSARSLADQEVQVKELQSTENEAGCASTATVKSMMMRTSALHVLYETS